MKTILAVATAVLATLVLGVSSALAGSYYWDNSGAGSWGLNTNWSLVGVPGSGDTAYIHNGGTTLISSNVTLAELLPAHDAGSTGQAEISGAGSSLNATTYLIMGWQNNTIGSFTQHDGAVTVGAYLNVGQDAGSEGHYTMHAGTLDCTNYMTVGASGKGYFTQEGGDVTVSNSLYAIRIGQNAGSTGVYELKDGTLTSGPIFVGDKGTGTITQTGGVITPNASNGQIHIGSGAGSNGTWNISGSGTMLDTNRPLIVGVSGSGTVNQSGDTLVRSTYSSRFEIGQKPDSHGAWNLSDDAVLEINGSHLLLGSATSGTTTAAFDLQDNSIVRLVGGARDIHVGWHAGSTGTWTMSGNSTLLASGNITVGSEGGTGSFNLDSGTVTMTNSGKHLRVGWQSTGTFTQSGGTVTALGCDLTLGQYASGNGTYTLTDGTLSVDLIQHGVGTWDFSFDGGMLHANTVNFALDNLGSGILAPGTSVGTTAIGGDYHQGAAATYQVEIEGTGVGGQDYDLVTVDGDAILAGWLLVDLVGTFDPDISDFFDVMTATGSIDTTSLVLAGDTPTEFGWAMSVVGGPAGGQILRLTAVPEPAAITLMGFAVTVLLLVRRKRRG